MGGCATGIRHNAHELKSNIKLTGERFGSVFEALSYLNSVAARPFFCRDYERQAKADRILYTAGFLAASWFEVTKW